MERSLETIAVGPGELGALLDLYRHLHADERPLPLAEAAEILARFSRFPGSRIQLARRGDMALASCTLVVVPNLTRGGTPYGLIENVITHAGYRRRGLGKAMLAVAAEAAWQEGCYKVMLMTGSRDEATLRFYAGAGFEQTKTGFEIRRVPRRGDPDS